MMERSARFELVRGYFVRGLWGVERVRRAVGVWITEEEFVLITGEEFGG